MFKVLYSVALFTFVCVLPAVARNLVMEEIQDAGIYCPTSSPEIDRFYSAVEKQCKGKVRCRVGARMVTTEQDLLQHRCTGLFVAPVCRGTPVNVESRYDVLKTLLVSCKR